MLTEDMINATIKTISAEYDIRNLFFGVPCPLPNTETLLYRVYYYIIHKTVFNIIFS
jgi:hypothetical protein